MALGKATSGNFRRVQLLPDMMPREITGTLIYNSDYALPGGYQPGLESRRPGVAGSGLPGPSPWWGDAHRCSTTWLYTYQSRTSRQGQPVLGTNHPHGLIEWFGCGEVVEGLLSAS
jgi:hypothetical protein